MKKSLAKRKVANDEKRIKKENKPKKNAYAVVDKENKLIGFVIGVSEADALSRLKRGMYLYGEPITRR